MPIPDLSAFCQCLAFLLLYLYLVFLIFIPLYACALAFFLWQWRYCFIFLILQCKFEPKVFILSIKLINLYKNFFALANLSTMIFVIFFASVLSTLLTPTFFNKHKNLILGILGLTIVSHVTTNNFLIIEIYNQLFTFWKKG